jgi:hypothetical protein
MENSPQKQSRVALELQLVKELERMRDKLTELSLVMHDLKFQVDVPQRAEAQDIAANCIMRSMSSQY